MADKVLVRVAVTLTDIEAGDEAWVEETDKVTGMVAGGYWEIVDREAAPAAAPKSGRKTTEEAAGGADQAEPR